MTGTDWGATYRATIEAVGALVGSLSPEQASLPVPATPAWTVHDLLAHLAGGASDLLAGRMDDAPSPEWSARHVGERAGRSPEELVAEMTATIDAVSATFESNGRPAIAFDAAVHHADLHEALGKGAPPDDLWRPVLEVMAPRLLGEHLDQVGPVPDYELFRALFSRRSRSQMQAWGTPLDPATLDGLCIFGPREDDQPVPD